MSNDLRIKLINWAYSCHTDSLIAIKEIKGPRWMAVLSYLEIVGDFNFDSLDSKDAWKKIRSVINNLDDTQLIKVNKIKNEN